jgi:HAD superfamily hydrolase (TIGR01490 family)
MQVFAPEAVVPEAGTKSAAFYDVDGTLVSTNVVHAFAYYAANRGRLLESALRISAVVAGLPVFWAADQVSRTLFNELFYRQYKGISRDRLIALSEELFEKVLRPAIYPGAEEMIERCRRTGARQVLVTGAIDLTILPLARHFGMDDVIANELEFVGNVATGRIKKPLLASGVKAAAVRDYCAKNGLDLSACWGFCDSYADYPMLAVVGRPVAVNPDFRLRAMARTHDWPVVELR